MTNPSLYLTLKKRTEADAREEIATALDREAAMWNRRGDGFQNTIAQATCYSLANEAIERAKQQRARAASLREKG